ncbi:hypothetical protein H4582DRAFT_1823258 [Lactarius indigo]|nr:hypothetical protein H4582DRAFT_1823258 [Lactarius indigo]
MAAASLDVDVKEELSAMEQWFKVLSEAERTAALYTQMRFFTTVLQRMARADLVIALLSPAVEVYNAEPDGSKTCKYESQIARTQVYYTQFPLRPHLQHQRHEPPIARLRLVIVFPIPRYRQHRRQPERLRGYARATAR